MVLGPSTGEHTQTKNVQAKQPIAESGALLHLWDSEEAEEWDDLFIVGPVGYAFLVEAVFVALRSTELISESCLGQD